MSTVQGGWRRGNIVSSGLILYIDASVRTSFQPKLSTTQVKDLSDNQLTGVLENGVQYDNTSFIFDGISAVINMGDNDIFSFNNGFTIEYWFAIPDPIIQCTIAEKYQSSGREYIHGFFNNSFRTTVFDQNVPGGANMNARIDNITPYVNANEYFHGATTYDGGTTPSNILFYINGVNIPSTYSAMVNTFTQMYNYTTPLTFARANPGYGSPINGKLSQMRMYNRALTPSEIQQNFNATRGRFGI